MTQTADGTPDAPLDLAAARAIIDAQRDRVRTTTYADDRLIFGVWAAAWSVGYGVLGGLGRDDVTAIPWWGWATFGVLMMAAVATTIVHTRRRMSGMTGVSRRTGELYGWSWFVAFAAGQTLVGGLAGAGLPDEAVALAANGISALIVAILYMAGGALWQDRAQFALGVWMAVVAAVATSVGLPWTFAVMGLAGGGGMALAALLAHLAQRQSRRNRVARPGVTA